VLRNDLGDGAGGPGEGDGVDPAELDGDPPPRHPGAPLSDTDQQQGEPAQQHVGADAWFDAVSERPPSPRRSCFSIVDMDTSFKGDRLNGGS